MSVKETFFVKITDTDAPGICGVGECALFRGLSSEDSPLYEAKLADACRDINKLDLNDIEESSIKFGFETALNDLKNGGKRVIFDSQWIKGEQGIPINGLVWMGDFNTMLARINEKIESGFKCIKIKIGGIDFNRELELLKYIRDSFSPAVLQLRLDANGSMTGGDALQKLDRLARFDIHSIEQPVMPGQWKIMKEITRNSPIDIALDEELIGNFDYDKRCFMLDATMPRYIILKPSLHGGFNTCDNWINDATDREIGWWATSALESNIGLNAIGQWTSTKNITMPQGLGTGQLYHNNIQSPLVIKDAALHYTTENEWNLGEIDRL